MEKELNQSIIKEEDFEEWMKRENEEIDKIINTDEYRNNEKWSQYLADTFSNFAAVSFIVGTDILGDILDDNINILSHMPKGTHIGEISEENYHTIFSSYLPEMLPKQFLTYYNHEFLSLLKTRLNNFVSLAKKNETILAHSILDEILFYLILQSSFHFFDEVEDELKEHDCDEWIFDMFDDMDIITFLYSDMHISKQNTFHFDNWATNQFYGQ